MESAVLAQYLNVPLWSGSDALSIDSPCPSCNGPLGVTAPRLRDDCPTFYECSRCNASWLADGTLPELRRFFERERVARARSSTDLPLSETPGEVTHRVSPTVPFVPVGDRMEYGTPLSTVTTLPLGFLLAYLFVVFDLSRLLLSLLISMGLHEWGHALTCWLSGRPAIPLPFLTLPLSSTHHVWAWLLVEGLLGATFFVARREGLRVVKIASLFLMAATLTTTWLVPQALTFEWVIFAGVGGEFVLGTLLVSSFYFRLPDRLRWDFWRYPAVVAGAFSITNAMHLWGGARSDIGRIPWGTALGGHRDMGGDVNLLVYQYDFSARELVDWYYWLGLSCLGFLGLLYGFMIWRAYRQQPEFFRSLLPLRRLGR